MSLVCQCPAAAALPDVVIPACSENFGQIQKVAFVRLTDGEGNKNGFIGTGTPLAPTIGTLSAWLAFLTAQDGTKIVVSPYINAPADSGGDARMSSGGNDDLGGIPEVLGGEPVQFTGSIRAVAQSVIKALKPLQCEANAGNLGVYLFDENGNIEAIQDSETPTTYRPIPIRALFIGSKVHGNYDAKDSNAITWYYPDNYSDDLVIIKPEFNPLTDLVVSE